MTGDIPKLRSPIVLVHGLLGVSRIQVGDWTLASYFGQFPKALTAAGNRVLQPQLSLTGGVGERAEQLKKFLDGHAPHEPAHLIAHSMGGLDCRYLISKLGFESRVLTLTTIGTPHRGSPFADWSVRHFERLVKPLLDWFDSPRQAFYDLTTARCREFNEQVPDAARVRYFSIAGRHEGDWWSPEWQFPHQIVLQAEGPNDGVVSVTSATYGESLNIWEGDHLSLISWPSLSEPVRGRVLDRAADYTALVRRLADAGF
jgi:triacylglycerol lipase